MHFTASLDHPFPIKFANQCCVFIYADHAFPFFELPLQSKNNRLPNPGDGIEVWNDEGGRDNPKPFLRSSQAKTWHAPPKDHGACRTARIDSAAGPGALRGAP